MSLQNCILFREKKEYILNWCFLIIRLTWKTSDWKKKIFKKEIYLLSCFLPWSSESVRLVRLVRRLSVEAQRCSFSKRFVSCLSSTHSITWHRHTQSTLELILYSEYVISYFSCHIVCTRTVQESVSLH